MWRKYCFYTSGGDLKGSFLPKVSSSLFRYKTVTGPGITSVGLSWVRLSSRDKEGAGAHLLWCRWRYWTRTAQADQHLVSVMLLMDCCQSCCANQGCMPGSVGHLHSCAFYQRWWRRNPRLQMQYRRVLRCPGSQVGWNQVQIHSQIIL